MKPKDGVVIALVVLVGACAGKTSSTSTDGGTTSSGGGGGGPPVVLLEPNPADCAATRDAVPVGQACTTASTCNYGGSSCSCAPDSTGCGGPVVRACDPDAGITTNCCDENKTTWTCYDGPPYCTTPVPADGTPCTPGAKCALTKAESCGQQTIECVNGAWEKHYDPCAVSTRRAKRDIAYVSPEERTRLRDDLLRIQLATYRYKGADPSTHLGFIIEDTPTDSPAVLSSRERVDLYGYISMAVAAIQEQQRQIDRLERECKKR